MSLRRPEEPPFSIDTFPLAIQIALYYHCLDTPPIQVQELVLMKTRLQARKEGRAAGWAGCDYAEQHKYMDWTFHRFAETKGGFGWAWNNANIGRHIATGITKDEDFQMAFGLTEQEVEMLNDGGKVGFKLPSAILA